MSVLITSFGGSPSFEIYTLEEFELDTKFDLLDSIKSIALLSVDPEKGNLPRKLIGEPDESGLVKTMLIGTNYSANTPEKLFKTFLDSRGIVYEVKGSLSFLGVGFPTPINDEEAGYELGFPVLGFKLNPPQGALEVEVGRGKVGLDQARGLADFLFKMPNDAFPFGNFKNLAFYEVGKNGGRRGGPIHGYQQIRSTGPGI